MFLGTNDIFAYMYIHTTGYKQTYKSYIQPYPKSIYIYIHIHNICIEL